MNKLKNAIKEVCIFFKVDLTKNIKYDRLTRKILNENLGEKSNCIDVGCHKGEILDIILKQSPGGTHFAFEPIPMFYSDLERNYNEKCSVFPFALTNYTGKTTFHFVENAPAYSGIKQREYAVSEPIIQELEVEARKLDEVILPDIRIDFIKIDVEGGEFDVLKGGEATIKKSKPKILFEFGKGASEFYETKAEELFDFFESELGLNVNTLEGFINKKGNLSKLEFQSFFNQGTEYYFIAYNGKAA